MKINMGGGGQTKTNINEFESGQPGKRSPLRDPRGSERAIHPRRFRNAERKGGLMKRFERGQKKIHFVESMIVLQSVHLRRARKYRICRQKCASAPVCALTVSTLKISKMKNVLIVGAQTGACAKKSATRGPKTEGHRSR